MVSSLFDPAAELAFAWARKRKSAAPARLVPFLSFKTLPSKAKETIIEVIDEDDLFRKRVAKGVTEAKHGRFTYSYLARPEGWETFVSQMVAMDEEPLGDEDSGSPKGPAGEADNASSTNSTSKTGETNGEARTDATAHADVDVEALAVELSSTINARDTAVVELEKARSELASVQGELDQAKVTNGELASNVEALTKEIEDLTAQRQRAVSELKTTESHMARHIAEKKQVEGTLEQMTSAQLSSAAVGGAITDVEVRVGLDGIDESLAQLHEHVQAMRRASTPERISVARRVALAPPLGIVDDSVEFANYLLAIPNVVVLIDGYNVTKQAVPKLDLEKQRNWLEQKLRDISASMSGRFEVIFDGADVSIDQGSNNARVRIRFSPDGVEADDVIISSVEAIDARYAVVVVSADKRVREGAAEGGANVLTSEQLIGTISSK